MQQNMLSQSEIEDHGISDPVGYAVGSWDTDLLPVVADALATGRTHFVFQPVVAVRAVWLRFCLFYVLVVIVVGFLLGSHFCTHMFSNN